MGYSDAKIPNLGGGLECKGAHFPPLRSHTENQLPHFPQAIGPTPSPVLPLQADTPHVKDLNWQKMTLVHRKSS